MSTATVSEVIAGRYRLGARLGAGGMGEVFRARDLTLGRSVAIKVLPEALAGRPGFVERFRAEAQAAARLSHPGVVAVHDWGSDAGCYFMVMEYVRGRSLREVLALRGGIEPAQAAALADQLLLALEAAHQCGLVHRDIKPENILVTTGGVVKVADFGIARLMDESTATMGMIGTARYAAPEQIRGEPVDARADLYSAGCVLYELLSGAPPFEGTVARVLHQHLNARVPAPSEAVPEAAPLDGVVALATEPDPGDRYPTAAAMRTALLRAAADLPPGAALSELAADLTSQQPSGVAALTEFAPAPPTRGRREQPGNRARRRPARHGRRHRAGWGWSVLLACLLGALVAGVVAIRPLPRVTGLSAGRAASRLSSSGLKSRLRQAYSDSAPVGTVIAAHSAGLSLGRFAVRGATVALTVSKGPDLVQLPFEVGQPLATAQQAIGGAGLPLAPVTEAYSSSAAAGMVIAQVPGSPPGPIAVRRGTPVNLTVSKGPQLVPVPALSGPVAGAASALTQAGLTMARQDVWAASAAGSVISQNPPAGASVPLGQAVTVVVSKGAQPFAMPNVKNLTCAAAAAELRSAGLTVSSVNTSGGSGCASGRVLEQDPVSGIDVQAGSPATLYVP